MTPAPGYPIRVSPSPLGHFSVTLPAAYSDSLFAHLKTRFIVASAAGDKVADHSQLLLLASRQGDIENVILDFINNGGIAVKMDGVISVVL